MTGRIILAAPESGSGKTLITAGIGLALRQRGLTVQMFKAGPDYIDPTYHRLASGRPCRNLDSWMLPREMIAESLMRNSRDADIALIEGVMGLFDGFGVETNEGSSADLSELLQASIVLILPVRGQARSAAATVLGFNTFAPNIKLAGVILNKVGSARHAALCQQAIETETAVPVLGYLPRNDAFHLPERHLGLIPTDEEGDRLSVLQLVADQLAETVDLERLMEISEVESEKGKVKSEEQSPISNLSAKREISQSPNPRIAIASDAAFSFTYPENVELLTEAGAELVYFSPLHDEQLPPNIDALILSGGFPEVYAQALSKNVAMRNAIRQLTNDQLPIYAECGGLMYLTQSITDHDGNQWPMVGALAGNSEMTKKVTLGYRLVEVTADSPILHAGERVRGHEFHYSKWSETPDTPAYLLHDPRGKSDTVTPHGIHQGNIWASYIHIHFLSRPDIAQRFVTWVQEAKKVLV